MATGGRVTEMRLWHRDGPTFDVVTLASDLVLVGIKDVLQFAK
jgi:hypothetical protein